MALPDVDTLSSAGGALNDLSPPIDPTTDRSAAGANVGFADATAMTHTAWRIWCAFTLNGTNAPVLVAHDEVWNTSVNPSSTPVLARTGVGIGTITYPAQVFDEIPLGFAGYFGGQHNVNLRAGRGAMRNGATLFHVTVTATSANVLTYNVFNASGALADPTTQNFDVWAL